MDCPAAGDVPSQPYIIDDPAETEEVEQAATLPADVESSELGKRKPAETGARPKISIKASSSSYACTIRAYDIRRTPEDRSSKRRSRDASRQEKPWQLFLDTPETAAADRTHKYLCTISEEGLQQLQACFSQQRAEDWGDVQRRVKLFVTDSVRQRLAGMKA
uniref:Uncharacterized protein n=1 Tax=Tetradesmus obliquus TaxID=3088 RepID=A0A383W0C1_TETOB|eukprot:jgi/Sobl393_1/16750/SZX70484.1